MPSRKLVFILLFAGCAAGVYFMTPQLVTPAARSASLDAGPIRAAGLPEASAETKRSERLASAAAMTQVSLPAENNTSETSPEETVQAFTEPYQDIAVAASEMGTLSEVRVHEGDIIRRDEIIAVMHDDVLRASLEVARRSMSVEGLLKSAQADLDLKKSEQEKLVQLRDRNHASQQEVDRIATDLKVAEARLLSVREDLEVKLLEFRRIEAQLEQRIVRAPVDGVVADVLRDPGEFLSPSDPVIARIVRLDSLLILFSVPLARRNAFEKDQTVALKIGETQQIAEGVVEYVSPTPDSSNSSIRVKVRLPNSDGRFLSGEPVVLVLNSIDPPASSPAQSETTPVARHEP